MFWDDLDNVDYKNMKIADLLKDEKDMVIYEYDFGVLGWYNNFLSGYLS